ncbi:MAG: RluA family pseudouridine synthase [Spirochaetes bacterium]|nr:RluA family pseudouridine synthase [Spirochaetota bacterium]
MQEEITLTSTIHRADAGKRLIAFLCGRFRYHDDGEWRSRILEGKVTVNGAPAEPERPLEAGDTVAYRVVLQEPPVDGNIVILHEEETFLVAAKSGNLPTHADGNFIRHTFVYILREMLQDRGLQGPVNPVNRLDRETSGCIVVSKQREAHRALTRQFEAGTVDKEYIAVVRGPVPRERFEVRGSIARDSGSSVSLRKTVVPEGHPGAKASVTEFTVLERLRGFTVLACRPRTGRTNQIRIHLEHAGHPLAGDKLYGRSDDEYLAFVHAARARRGGDLPWLEAERHMLHAQSISLDHPVTGDRVRFDAPLPQDMCAFMERHR